MEYFRSWLLIWLSMAIENEFSVRLHQAVTARPTGGLDRQIVQNGGDVPGERWAIRPFAQVAVSYRRRKART
jgi:hypothetical protein